MKKSLAAAIMTAAFLWVGSVAFADKNEYVFVKRANTTLLDQPARSAAVIAPLAEGEKLRVKEGVGKYYRVVTESQKEGFVPRFRVGSHPPGPTATDQEDLDDMIGALAGGTRTAALRDTGVSHAIRGRHGPSDEEGETSLADAKESLARLQGVRVTPDELEKFQRTGGVGLYAN